jgi:hypothetical protein
MYWSIRDLWGPTNLVALMVNKLDDTPPNLMDDRRDSVGATHGCPLMYRVEDLCHTPFQERGNEASIRVPRMFKSHVRPTIW